MVNLENSKKGYCDGRTCRLTGKRMPPRVCIVVLHPLSWCTSPIISWNVRDRIVHCKGFPKQFQSRNIVSDDTHDLQGSDLPEPHHEGLVQDLGLTVFESPLSWETFSLFAEDRSGQANSEMW